MPSGRSSAASRPDRHHQAFTVICRALRAWVTHTAIAAITAPASSNHNQGMSATPSTPLTAAAATAIAPRTTSRWAWAHGDDGDRGRRCFGEATGTMPAGSGVDWSAGGSLGCGADASIQALQERHRGSAYHPARSLRGASSLSAAAIPGAITRFLAAAAAGRDVLGSGCRAAELLSRCTCPDGVIGTTKAAQRMAFRITFEDLDVREEAGHLWRGCAPRFRVWSGDEPLRVVRVELSAFLAAQLLELLGGAEDTTATALTESRLLK